MTIMPIYKNTSYYLMSHSDTLFGTILLKLNSINYLFMVDIIFSFNALI